MNQNIINYFIENGLLLAPDALKGLNEENSKELIESLNSKLISSKLIVVTKDLWNISIKAKGKMDINWNEFERGKVLVEKGRNDKTYNTFLDILNYGIEDGKKKELDKLLENVKIEDKLDNEDKSRYNESDYSNVIVLKEYHNDPRKLVVNDFVEYFRLRYNLLKDLLQNRQELQGVISINRILAKKEKDIVSFIGIVHNKRITKNGNVLITLEDLTGMIDVLVNKEGKAIDAAKNVVLDEIIGVVGVNGGRVIFVTQIVFPDVPLTHEFKKSDDETYAAFISDLHFGSRLFLKDDFLRFVDWINGNSGSFLQKKVSSKVKYLFIVGDAVDGVGVYPGQEKELIFKDITQQYNQCAEFLGMIRKDIKIILAPGQHDSIRVAEPQPPLDQEFSNALFSLPNIVMVSNPSLVNIHSKKNFEGFNVLMYHGASYHYYIDSVDSLRQAAARDNPTMVLKFLLQKRHLAPTHASTVYVPVLNCDPFFIDKVPDIIVSGEMHRSDVCNYNNITLINCSCFQGKTPYQEKTGNNPNPSRVPILNLNTREVKIFNFSNEE